MISVKVLEEWKQGPRDEIGKSAQAVVKEHRFAAFKKLTDLIPRPDRDTHPLTHSLDILLAPQPPIFGKVGGLAG